MGICLFFLLVIPSLGNVKMDVVKKKCKIVWNCCKRSLNAFGATTNYDMLKSNGSQKKKNEVAPQGCFYVYVGPERQRFVLKIETANHPMFKMLLDDAESEYGFSNDGPIWLPCNVDLFCEALAEMEDAIVGCKFYKAHGSVKHWQISCHDYKLLSSSTSST